MPASERETVSDAGVVNSTTASPLARFPHLARARVALVHDYLFEAGGAEYVAGVLCQLFPDAPLYTSIVDPRTLAPAFTGHELRTSFMQRITHQKRFAKALLPLYPFAFRRFDFSAYDLIVSSSSGFAKDVRVPPGVTHVCYCHTPAHFIWDLNTYARSHASRGLPLDLLVAPLLPALRAWDRATAQSVAAFVANSAHTRSRIATVYGRDATVIYPPIELSAWHTSSERDDYFLVVSRLLPYKRVDLAVRACTALGLPLRVVGAGPDRERLQAIAGPTVVFEGRVATEVLRQRYARCQAFILPGAEDLGLTALEAQAAGRPVIALRAGGALETVREGTTGAFFDAPEPEALAEILRTFDSTAFDPAVIRAHAASFDVGVFSERLLALLDGVLAARTTNGTERGYARHAGQAERIS
jgi:glycosyltransferase involved in cell wall biosynthesis